jgi:hypothetical protein
MEEKPPGQCSSPRLTVLQPKKVARRDAKVAEEKFVYLKKIS